MPVDGYNPTMVPKSSISVLFALCAGLAGFASADPIPLGDRLLVDVIADYEAAGYTFTYSSELVRRHTRIAAEPPPGDALSRLREGLATLGLQLLETAGDRSYLVVLGPSAATVGPAEPRRVAGRVTDAASGRPLAGARVEIDGIVTRTDADGRFALDIYQPRGLSASLSGYASKTVPVAGPAPAPADEVLELALEPSIEEVVVAASRYRIGKRGTLSRHVLDDALLIGLPDIGDALRIVNRLPGARTIGLSAIPRIRGGFRDETLVLFNNVELLEPVHLKDFHGLFSGLDPRVIKSIDVYTGGFPARYGNRMSGVLDIEPAEPPPRPAGALTLSLFNAGAMAHGPAAGGRGDWTLSVRRGNLDVIARRLERNVGTPSFHDAYGRFSWEFDPRTLIDAGLIIYNDDVEAIDDQGPHSEHAFSRYRNTYGWTQLRRDWPDGAHTRTVLAYASIRHTRAGLVRSSGPDWGSGTVDDLRRFRILDIAQEATFARSGWSAEFGGGARLASGHYDYQASGHRGALAGLLGQPRDLAHQVRARPEGWAWHLFGAVSVKAWRAARVEAGVRWDRQTYGVVADQISPRFTLRYDIDASTAVTVAAGSFSQPQGIHELQVEDGLSGYQRPQNAHHLIAGIERAFAELGLQVHAEIFIKRFTRPKRRFENPLHALVLLPELAPDRLSSHPSAARARGAEATVRYRPSPTVNAWFSYTWGEAEDRVARQWRPRRWDQTNSVSAGWVWTTEPWSAAVTFLWHDGWRTTPLPPLIAEGTKLAPDWNDERLPAFASLDVRISRTWRWGAHGLTIFAECANILDRTNVGAVEYELLHDPSVGGFGVAEDPRKLFPVVPSAGLVWEFR